MDVQAIKCRLSESQDYIILTKKKQESANVFTYATSGPGSLHLCCGLVLVLVEWFRESKLQFLSLLS